MNLLPRNGGQVITKFLRGGGEVEALHIHTHKTEVLKVSFSQLMEIFTKSRYPYFAVFFWILMIIKE